MKRGAPDWRGMRALGATVVVLWLACIACTGGPSSTPAGSGQSSPAEATSALPSAVPSAAATVPSPFPDDDFARLVRTVAGPGPGAGDGELDQLWRRVLAIEEVDYEAPSALVSYRGGEEVPESGCSLGTGIAFWRQNARYCPPDRTVLYDELWLRDFAEKAGSFAPAAILAHEWGHHVQELLATRGLSIQLELQADCFAGMHLGTSEQVTGDAYEIRVEELASGLQTFFSIGNRDYAEDSWFQAYEHGSQNQRLVAFGTGYLGALGEFGGFGELVNGYPWCAGYAGFEAGERTDIGPYTLLNPPGRSESWEGDSYTIEPAPDTRQPTSSIAISWLDQLPLANETSALEQLRAVVARERAGTILLYDPLPMDVTGARAAAHYFERSAGGEAAEGESGLVYLQLPDGQSGALLLVVQRPEPAARDPLTREKLAIIAEHMVTLHQIINRLCAPYQRDSTKPGGGNVACLAEQ